MPSETLVERTHTVQGHPMRALEAGEGPLVLLLHGFPALGRTFVRQVRALAAAGFRAVAPDMRGYGGTHAPPDPRDYALDRVLPELEGLLDVLGEQRAIVVGHDFGALCAWQFALRIPGRCAGVAALAVPYDPRRAPTAPSEAFARTAKRHFVHVHYFQAEGVAERELDAAPREFLRRVYYALSGHGRYEDVWKHPSEGRGYLDTLPEAPPLPFDFLSVEEFEALAETYARTGFRGGLNWYRAYDANHRLGEPYAGLPVEVPALFVAGERDPAMLFGGPKALDVMRAHVPNLRGEHILPGAGHFVQLERTAEVDRLLVGFARELTSGRA